MSEKNQQQNRIKNLSRLDGSPTEIVSNIKNDNTDIKKINQQINIDNQKQSSNNEIILHTLKDNLIHNYFHFFEMYWDARDPLSSAIIKFPKMNNENNKYWVTYTGEIDFYVGEANNNDTELNNNEYYWNLNEMKPFFRGSVGRVKEYPKEMEVQIDSIGRRFKQKIPEDFRQSYINGQNVRDAFQAICEFLGVKYICPPHTDLPQDEQTESTQPNTDGTENDVTQRTNQEQNIANQASQISQNVSFNNTQTNNQNSTSTNTQNGTTQQNDPNNSVANNETGTSNVSSNTLETDVQLNGFSDISFDVNGAIVHESVSIETSPDMTNTLIDLTEHPLLKYTEDTSYVAADVKKFLNGEMFETVHNSSLNYGAITIQPQSTTSTEMSTVDTSTGDMETGNNTETNNSTNSNNESVGHQTARAASTARSNSVPIRSVNKAHNKKALNDSYIKTLSISQASQKAQQTDYYDTNTIKKLRRRAMGLFW